MIEAQQRGLEKARPVLLRASKPQQGAAAGGGVGCGIITSELRREAVVLYSYVYF